MNNGSKAPRYFYLSVGFFAGALFVACSGGGSGGAAAIAQAVVNAIDVLFDNSSSGLSATNVQDAVDELASDLAAQTHDAADIVSGKIANARLNTGTGGGLDADLLDGKEATDFAADSHDHDAGEIVSGKIANARLNTGSGGGLDADLLDGLSSLAFAASAHGHAHADLSAIGSDDHHTRYADSEAVSAVLAADGTGSGVDADLLDGKEATDFASDSHGHAAAEIVSGKIANARLNTGAGGGIDADLLDGKHATEFASDSHGHPAGFRSYAEGTFVEVFEVPANGSVDFVPPVGESWFMDSVTSSDNAVVVNLTDGTVEFPFKSTGVDIENLGTQQLLFGSTVFVRFSNPTASPITCYFSGSRHKLDFVGDVQNLGAGQTLEFRPPAGETWLVAMAEGARSDFTLKTASLAAPLSISLAKSTDGPRFLVIDNDHWLATTNSIPGPRLFLITGARLP